ncbi:uncharacterized protein METZ01_LOCUS501779, partial [marine metagenome]
VANHQCKNNQDFVTQKDDYWLELSFKNKTGLRFMRFSGKAFGVRK